MVALERDRAIGKISESCFTINYRRGDIVLANSGDRIDCAQTRGLFIRWKDMRRVGGFHPRLLPHYLSDLEWTLRARRKGIAIHRDQRLWLVPDHENTGLHSLAGLPLMKRLVHIFSNKYAGNPLHWSIFIILCFPVRHWPTALFRIVRRTLASLRTANHQIARPRSSH